MTQTIPNISVDDTEWVDLNAASGIAVGHSMSIALQSSTWCRLYEGTTPPAIDSKDGVVLTDKRYPYNSPVVESGSLKIWAIGAQKGRTVDLNVQELFPSTGGGGGGGTGFTLGPVENAFTGVDRTAAELARDTYFSGAGSVNLPAYNGDTTLNIILEYNDGGDAVALFQVRNVAGDAWLDNYSAIGVKGDSGAASSISDEVYSASWDGDTTVAGSKNAIYDKMELVTSAVTLNTAKNSYPTTDSAKVGHISVTQAVNLDTIESDVSSHTTSIATNTTEISKIRTTTGTSTGDANMGVFTGSTISDNSSIKVGMQELETSLETKGTVNDAAYDSGWDGITNVAPSKNSVYDKVELLSTAIALNTAKTTYPSSDSTKVGYITVTQAVDLDTIESDVSGNASDISDIRTTTGTSDNDTDLGVFSGTTISDNVSVKTGMQELETSLETKGTVDDAAYSVAWDNDTTVAPSKNAVYDKVELLNTDVALNTTHRSSTGADHSFIDQDVKTTASPTFVTVNATTLAGQLATASQPSITSLGTLNSLGVTNNATIGGDIDVAGQIKVGGVDVVGGLLELASVTPDVDLPLGNSISRTLNGDLTPERSTVTGNINKSGVSETLGVDKIAITKNGASIYGAYVNSLLQSENIGDTVWIKPGTATATQDGTLSSDGITQAWKVENSVSEPLQNTVAGLTLSGQPVLFYEEVKAGSSNIARIRWIESTGGTTVDKQGKIDLTTGVVSGSTHTFTHVEKLANGWWGVWWANTTNNTGNTVARMDIGNADEAGVGSIYVSKCMLVDGIDIAVPYQATTTAPVPRGADSLYFPMMNNMPYAGGQFTIICDSGDIPTSVTTNLFMWSGDSIFYARRQVVSGAIQFATGGGTATTVNNFDTSNGVRFAFVYDGTNAIIYANGVEVATATTGTPSYDINNTFSIGSYYTFIQHVNSSIKGVEIYHTALSAVAIAAKGSV